MRTTRLAIRIPGKKKSARQQNNLGERDLGPEWRSPCLASRTRCTSGVPCRIAFCAGGRSGSPVWNGSLCVVCEGRGGWARRPGCRRAWSGTCGVVVVVVGRDTKINSALSFWSALLDRRIGICANVVEGDRARWSTRASALRGGLEGKQGVRTVGWMF